MLETVAVHLAVLRQRYITKLANWVQRWHAARQRQQAPRRQLAARARQAANPCVQARRGLECQRLRAAGCNAGTATGRMARCPRCQATARIEEIASSIEASVSAASPDWLQRLLCSGLSVSELRAHISQGLVYRGRMPSAAVSAKVAQRAGLPLLATSGQLALPLAADEVRAGSWQQQQIERKKLHKQSRPTEIRNKQQLSIETHRRR